MEQSSPGLEEIFDSKLKAYASLDYKELKNPVDYYQNSIFVKQLEQRALCNRDRASPTLFLPPRGRSASPTVLSTINLNNPNLSNPNCRRIKPADPWGLNLNPHCDLNNGDLSSSHLSSGCKNVGAFNILSPNGLSTIAGCTRPSTPCDSSISPKRLGSPSLRSKVLANRDKESLMDEIIELKKALLDQSVSLQRQKVISSNLELENRKLEKELEELAYQGSTSKGVPRPGSLYDTRLRSKVQGLKTRVSQLEATCEVQQEELALLRRDARVTRTRDLQKSLEKASKEIHDSSRRGNESSIRAKRAERQCQDLHEQSAVLSKMVEKEKSEKLKLQQMIHVLQDEVQNLQASLSSKLKLQSSTNSLDQNQHEEHQTGILAKTWGFLHGGAFHTSQARELDAVECEKLIIGERPKTRGEQRTKLAGGDPLEGKRSRPRSPAKATNKKAVETSKLPQTSGLTQNHAQDGRERHHSTASKSRIQEGNPNMAEKPVFAADKPAQASRTIEDPRSLLLPLRHPSEESTHKANLNNLDRLHNSHLPCRDAVNKEEQHQSKDAISLLLPLRHPSEESTHKANLNNFDRLHNSQLPCRDAVNEEAEHQSKDAIAKLMEGMINIQESMHNGENKNSGNSQSHRKEEGHSLSLQEGGGAQASTGQKVASSILIPRLNLHQVGGHPHHTEENISEESSNPIETSASTNTAFEQSHRKVIAWDDNIHNSQERHELFAPPLDQKLAIIEESTNAT